MDVVVATSATAKARAVTAPSPIVRPGEMILDIGPRTAAAYAALLAKAGTIVWNGPVGMFELDAFGKGHEADRRSRRGLKPSASPAEAIRWRRSRNTG